MDDRNHVWALVLAAGDGMRLRGLTTDGAGLSTPKQFCSLHGGQSLVGEAIDRAERLAPRERVLAVVAAAHARWWASDLAGLPAGNVVIQPENRGTGLGLLLPIVDILERDADALIAVIPSDHHVRDEATLQRAFDAALTRLDSQEEPITLLGITPDSPEPDYGWIVPVGRTIGGTRQIGRFVEKPSPGDARRLLEAGGVWNSFLLAVRGADLLRMFRQRLPRTVDALVTARRTGSLASFYAGAASVDFSRDVLQGAERELRVMMVPPCGWTDLGTPDRVRQCLRELAPPPVSRPLTQRRFSLALQLA